MAQLVIADIDLFYKNISEASRVEETIEDEETIEESFKDSIALPHNRSLQANFTSEGRTYRATISVYSENASDFSGFQSKIKKDLRKTINIEAVETSRIISCLREFGGNYFTHGVSMIEGRCISSLNLYFGSNGLFPRNISDEKEFRRTIEELEKIASIVFHPYLIGKNIPNDQIYFLNPIYQKQDGPNI